MTLLPYEAEFDAAFDTILKERLPAIAYDDDIRALSDDDKILFLIMYFDCQVLNGGIEQWFRNPTGAFTHETLAALVCVGADVSAGIIRELIEMFSGIAISQDYEERRRQFDALPKQNIDRVLELSDLYSNSREGGQIFEKTYKYINTRRQNVAK